MLTTSVYFLPRAQAAKARQLGAEPRVIVPARQISTLAEREPGPAPAKLSAADALRIFNVKQGGR